MAGIVTALAGVVNSSSCFDNVVYIYNVKFLIYLFVQSHQFGPWPWATICEFVIKQNS